MFPSFYQFCLSILFPQNSFLSILQTFLPEDSNNIGSGPAKGKRGVRRFAQLGHFIYTGLAHPDF